MVFDFSCAIFGYFKYTKLTIIFFYLFWFLHWHFQFGASGMLDDWEENLAVITANRTKDDELVLIHLGDCMWKEKNDVSICTNDF